MSGYTTGGKGHNGYHKTRGNGRVSRETTMNKFPSIKPVTARSQSVYDVIYDFS